jgi:choline dehydrogenase-like flavoprotein
MALVGEGSPGSAFISAGDRHGIKQAAPQTFLKDAAESGAHFADRTYVSEVLHDGKGSVTGVKATMINASGQALKVTVRARTVVVSCGSINTPALLMRSQIPKLNQSGQLGKNLRLHPVATTLAVMPEKVKVWEGAPGLSFSYNFDFYVWSIFDL